MIRFQDKKTDGQPAKQGKKCAALKVLAMKNRITQAELHNTLAS